jgi:hypothetical protein
MSALLAGLGVAAAVRPAVAAPPTMVKMTATAPGPVAAGRPFTLTVDIHIVPPYHIQANPPKEGYIGTLLTIGPNKGLAVGKINYPKGTTIVMAGETLPIYRDSLTLKVPLTAAKPGKYVVPLALRFQACNETQCYPPEIAGATVAFEVTGAAKGHH